MARKKTSAEKAREDAENEKVENMLDGAFGTLSGLETTKPEENLPENDPVVESEVESEESENQEILESEEEETQDVVSDVDEPAPKEETEDAPTEEENPPEEELQNSEDEDKDLPSLPESGPSKGPPSGPPSKGPPSGPPSKGPPSGPPSKGPPSGPPNNPPAEENLSAEEPVIEDEVKQEVVEEITEITEESTEEVVPEIEDLEKEQEEPSPEEPVIEQEVNDAEVEQAIEEMASSEQIIEPEALHVEEPTTTENTEITEGGESINSDDEETEAEIARLSAEVERLRRSMAGAAEVIEELENPPMPPTVMEDLVIGAHIVGDMARLARQLDREQLIRASMGTIAMLHPDQLEIIVSTKHMALLPRMDERDICAAKLGVDPPRGAPADWRVLEVVLASVSLITGGPAAVIHSHGPFTTAASCEKDLVLVQPIDEIGKKQIGKIIIVDPDDDNPEEFLRQVAEALQQGGMRCVVIRGKGAYAVGADLDQAWANAAMLEHSMKIVLLARQANLKV